MLSLEHSKEMEKILSLLKNYISGKKIAKEMGISRTSVCRKIEKLRNMGYEIESKKGVGYKLISKPDIPYPHEIKPKTKIIGKNIFYFKNLSSTNEFARKMVQKGAKEGTVIIAEEQTEGRGRKGRKWFSPPGGLWFSIILYPSLPPEKGGLLMMASSVSIVDSLADIGINAGIKWPNDILIGKKKVCGILMEMEASLNKINFAIVGIGINVYNKLHPSLENASTLQKFINKKISRISLIKSILEKFDENYQKLLEGDYESIGKKWISLSLTIGKELEIKEGNIEIKGKAIGIDENGFLLVKGREKIHRIMSGDVIIK